MRLFTVLLPGLRWGLRLLGVIPAQAGIQPCTRIHAAVPPPPPRKININNTLDFFERGA